MDKLKKGRGVHWDIVLLSLLNLISGLFGGPWICAATVRAMSHLAALTVMSTTHAPGESPKIVDIKGNRLLQSHSFYFQDHFSKISFFKGVKEKHHFDPLEKIVFVPFQTEDKK